MSRKEGRSYATIRISYRDTSEVFSKTSFISIEKNHAKQYRLRNRIGFRILWIIGVLSYE